MSSIGNNELPLGHQISSRIGTDGLGNGVYAISHRYGYSVGVDQPMGWMVFDEAHSDEAAVLAAAEFDGLISA